jgi:hypothetical protein
MDIHARIQQFLQQQTIHPSSEGAGDAIIKAGVVPFLRHPYRYYLMKPVAKNAGLDAPKFQLCKGTRMHRLPDGTWQDMQDGKDGEIKETLAETALREGIEELGLELEHIQQLFDMGPYDFSSASTGRAKKMWLFAAEMRLEHFSAEVAATTAERGWLGLDEFSVAGREDHRYILRDIERKLSKGIIS